MILLRCNYQLEAISNQKMETSIIIKIEGEYRENIEDVSLSKLKEEIKEKVMQRLLTLSKDDLIFEISNISIT